MTSIRGTDVDYSEPRHRLSRRRRRRVQPLQDLHPGSPPAGRGVGRQARLAGRRLLRQRAAAQPRTASLRRGFRRAAPTASCGQQFRPACRRRQSGFVFAGQICVRPGESAASIRRSGRRPFRPALGAIDFVQQQVFNALPASGLYAGQTGGVFENLTRGRRAAVCGWRPTRRFAQCRACSTTSARRASNLALLHAQHLLDHRPAEADRSAPATRTKPRS